MGEADKLRFIAFLASVTMIRRRLMWKAVAIMFVAMSMIPAGDLCGKLLTGGHGASPVFVAWSRFALGTAMVLPFAGLRGLPLLRDWRIWLRAGLLAGGIFSIQTALSTEPLADVFAAFFVGPIFSYVLAAIFLGERVSPLRSLLIIVGFCGVLLVVRPGLGGSAGLLWAVLAGLCYGGFLTASKWVSDGQHPIALIFTQLFLSAVFMLPLGLASLPPLTTPVIGLAVGSAAFSTAGNLLLLYAYARSAATVLAPMVYFQLISATVLGWLVFSDLPDIYAWVGLVLIIGAGLLSATLRR